MAEVDRTVTLSPEAIVLAEQDDVRALVNAITNYENDYFPVVHSIRDDRNRWYIDDDATVTEREIDYFIRGATFRALSDNEQREFLRRCIQLDSETADQRAWFALSGETDETGRLFPVANYTAEVPAMQKDLLLISGITAGDIEAYQPSAWSLTEKYGFKDRLQFANTIGAIILNQKRPEEGSYTWELSPGVQQRIFIGASMHGDFRMAARKEYTAGSISPVGTHELFAPAEPEISIGHYHTTELAFVNLVLKHLAYVQPNPKDQIETLQKASDHFNEQYTEDETSWPALYGDFGDDDGDIEIKLVEQMPVSIPNRGESKLWGYFRIPGAAMLGGNLALKCVTTNNNLTIQTIRHDEQGEEVAHGPELLIPAGSEHLLLAQFILQGNGKNGRTSGATIAKIIEARYTSLAQHCS